MHWPQAELWIRRLPPTGASPRFYIALTILCLTTGYVIVTGPPVLVAGLLAGGFLLTLWLIAPELAIYALVLLYPFSLTFNVGELRNLRPHDALLIAMGISLVASLLAGNKCLDRFRSPLGKFLLLIWVFLLVWGTVSYLMGPANQWLIKDPVRNTWYAYREIWRYLLPFPLLALCIKDRAMAHRIVDLTILVTTACALNGMWGSMIPGGRAVQGHFKSKNEMAALLVVVLPLAIAQAMLASDWKRRLTFGLTTLILMRTLMLTQSRGGYVALIASLLPFGLLLPRRRLVAVGAGCVLALGFLLVLRGNLLERPNVQRLLALQNPSEIHTMQWRQQQWAYFAGRLNERPLLGSGSGQDKSLLAAGRLGTAHNAYLSIAFSRGIPVAAAWIVLLAVMGSFSFYRAVRAVESPERAFWLGLLGMLIALATHGMVESALDGLRRQQFIWTMMAVALIELRGYRPVLRAASLQLRTAR